MSALAVVVLVLTVLVVAIILTLLAMIAVLTDRHGLRLLDRPGPRRRGELDTAERGAEA